MTRTQGLIAYRVLVGLLGLGAVVTEIATLVERGRFTPGNFFSFFTIESNCLAAAILIVSALALAAGRSDRSIALLRGANTVNMVVVGVAFSVLLAGLENTEFTAVPWDNTVLHYIIPIAVALDWLLDVPRVEVTYKQALGWLVFPVVYLGYSLIRGPVVDWYPYPFLDPDHHGYGGVAVVALMLLVASTALAVALARMTQRAARKPVAGRGPHRLRTARVHRVHEQACEVWSDGEVGSIGFAPMFPSPRVERVSPGHVVAIATGPNGTEAVVWRWYDAVVLGHEDDGSVRLWEPAHGEVVAQARASYVKQDPGSRAYASAGLPGADWWVVGSAGGSPEAADADLDEVEALYTENGLWSAVFE